MKYLLTAFVFFACSTGDAADTRSALEPSADAAAPAYPDGTTKVSIGVSGGLAGTKDDTYTILPATRQIAWNLGEKRGSYVSGNRTLSDEEYAPIDAALHGVHRVAPRGCLADSFETVMTFTTASSSLTVGECAPTSEVVTVDGMGAVFTALDQYAR